MEKQSKDEDLFSLLNSLLQASKDLHNSCNPIILALYCSSSDRYYTLQSLVPQTEKFLQLRNHPQLSRLAPLLSGLRDLINTERSTQDFNVTSILHRHFICYEIYRLSTAIGSEVQRFLDEEIIKKIKNCSLAEEEDECIEDVKINALRDLEKRLQCEFDGNLQETILKGKVFDVLEKMLSDPGHGETVREQAAACVLALVRFNKDVFCGLVLMGSIVPDLVSLASISSIVVLTSLIKLIRIPLIDEIECRGDIKRIVSLLETGGEHLRMRVIDCLCEIAYLGRSEVVKELLELRVVEQLMDLQRSEGLGNGNGPSMDKEVPMSETRWLDCLSRFAIQVQIGQGLSRREQAIIKSEIMERVRGASNSEAEALCIISDILWGPSP